MLVPLSPTFLLLFTLTVVINTQQCLNNEGARVSWWVMLTTPKPSSSSPPSPPPPTYLYYDSTSASPNFTVFYTEPSGPSTALTLTLLQINTLSLQTIAWNDANPNGSTSSTSAHSKTVLAKSLSTSLGFLLDHSLPSYPSFLFNLVSPTISPSQKIYAQHLFCISLTAPLIERISSHLRIIKTSVYQSNPQN